MSPIRDVAALTPPATERRPGLRFAGNPRKNSERIAGMRAEDSGARRRDGSSPRIQELYNRAIGS